MAKGEKIDVSTYETARGYLKSALEQMIGAGRSVKEFGEFALDKFGDTFIPYLNQFSQDIKNGSIKIKGLGESAKTTLFGRHVTLEERERMIREASYLRAEQRGFATGHEQEDWYEAEREVDQRLAQETGLVEKGRKALNSVSTTIEEEVDDIKQVVTGWLENNPEIGQTLSKVSKMAAGKKTTKTTAARTKKKTQKKTAPVKKAVKKKTAKKTAAKKKAVKKAATKKKTAKKKVVKKK
jgi:hypothetical protein